MVRAFYAMGRGRVPAVTSAAALALNATLDSVLSRKMANTAVGLVLSTVLVSCLSVLLLYACLRKDFRQHFPSTPMAATEAEGEDEGGQGGQGGGLRVFLTRTLAASAATALYCQFLLKLVLPWAHGGLLPLTKSALLPHSLAWLIDAALVAAAFATSWLVYFIAFQLTRPNPRTSPPQ